MEENSHERDFILKKISRETILEMVKLEQKWRYSKDIQNLYYKAYTNNINLGTFIEDQIQKGILRHFNYSSNELSVNEYRKIPKTYWNDHEVKSSLFYMNLNIFQFPEVKPNDNLIDVPLLTLNREPIQLSNLNNKPLVILAGSIT